MQKIDGPRDKSAILSALRARMSDFTEEDEQRLLRSLQWCIFKKGEILESDNDIFKNVFYINSGTARTYYIENGKECNYAFSFAGQLIILPMTLVRKRREPLVIQFLEETEVCYVPVNVLKDLPSLQASRLLQAINLSMLSYIKYMEEHVLMLRMDAKDRYRWVLEKYPHILEVVSVTQLASFLNVTKETLYRIRSGKY